MDKKSTPTKMPIWLKLCLWIGWGCIVQFYIVGIIGVIRGYSVQGFGPNWVMLGGAFLALISCTHTTGFWAPKKKYTTKEKWMPALISWCIVAPGMLGFLQGRYQKQGDEFYKQKNYPAAIAMYQKEVDTWYLRLRYNYREDMSLFGIAQSYCQLEDFEQARETYRRLLEMARGYYQQRGREELAELNRELKNIADFEKQLANASDDNQKAKILFNTALCYRGINCDKKAREQYELIQTLNIHEGRKEQAKEFAADLSW